MNLSLVKFYIICNIVYIYIDRKIYDIYLMKCLIPGRTRSGNPDFFMFFVRNSGHLDPFTDPLKIIRVN